MPYRAYQIDCKAEKVDSEIVETLLGGVFSALNIKEHEIQTMKESVIFQVTYSEKKQIKHLERRLNGLKHWRRQP